MTEQIDWTIPRETCAELLLQGAHPWQIVNSMEEVETLDDAYKLISEVRHLWGKEATGGKDAALDETLAQLKRVRRLAWDRWQKTREMQALKLVRETEMQIAEVQERVREVIEDAEGHINDLPSWVPMYLAAWGSKRPDGKRVTVSWAASVAGTTASTVRSLRMRSDRFCRMEYIARHGEGEHVASMIDAGLRGNASRIFESFIRLVDKGNPQAVLKAMEWLQNKPAILLQLTTMSDEQLLEYYSSLLAELAPGGGGDKASGSELADDAESSGEQPEQPTAVS